MNILLKLKQKCYLKSKTEMDKQLNGIKTTFAGPKRKNKRSASVDLIWLLAI